MEVTFRDNLIVDVKKHNKILERRLSRDYKGDNGKIYHEEWSEFENNVETCVSYSDGKDEKFRYDVPLLKGYTIRDIFVDNSYEMSVCLNNRWIVGECNGTYFSPHEVRTGTLNKFGDYLPIPDYNEEKKSEQKFNYSLKDGETFNVCFLTEEILALDSLGYKTRQGSDYTITWLHLCHRSIPYERAINAQPGWHLKSVYFGLGNSTELQDRYILENQLELKGRISYKPDKGLLNVLSEKFNGEYDRKQKGRRKANKFFRVVSFIAAIIFGIKTATNFHRFRYFWDYLKFFVKDKNFMNPLYYKKFVYFTYMIPCLIFVIAVLLFIKLLISKTRDKNRQYKLSEFYWNENEKTYKNVIEQIRNDMIPFYN